MIGAMSRPLLSRPLCGDGSFADLPGNGHDLVHLGAHASDLLAADALDIVEIELPVVRNAPAQGRLDRGARHGRRFEHAQCQFERELLGSRIVGAARTVAEREVAEQNPGARRSAP